MRMNEPHERKQYRSIPLRAHQTRTRTAQGYLPVPPAVTRLPLGKSQQSYTSRAAMPAHPDEESRLTVAPKNAVIRYTNDQGEEEWRASKQRIVFHKEPPRRRVNVLQLISVGMLLCV